MFQCLNSGLALPPSPKLHHPVHLPLVLLRLDEGKVEETGTNDRKRAVVRCWTSARLFGNPDMVRIAHVLEPFLMIKLNEGQ